MKSRIEEITELVKPYLKDKEFITKTELYHHLGCDEIVMSEKTKKIWDILLGRSLVRLGYVREQYGRKTIRFYIKREIASNPLKYAEVLNELVHK